ncbi:MAG: UV DNA damage repair endonuclease UvsE [Bacillota bacterium]
MSLRLGYAGINLSLQDTKDGPRLRSVTAKRLSTMEPRERRAVLYQVARSNLLTLQAVLRWNHLHAIQLFRITSDLIPLATHPVAAEWDWEADLAYEFRATAELAREVGARLTMHPGQYTVLNAPDPLVVERAVADLAYHARVLELLETGADSGLVLHIGGGYGDKRAAADRFVAAFSRLPEAVASRLWVENDDVTWDTAEVLEIARRIGRPMVFDLHHHRVLRTDDWLPWLRAILPTWGAVRPKLHFSSPKDGLRSRHHADFIDPDDFRAFLERVPDLDGDVVLECKMKDKALLALRSALNLPS